MTTESIEITGAVTERTHNYYNDYDSNIVIYKIKEVKDTIKDFVTLHNDIILSVTAGSGKDMILFDKLKTNKFIKITLNIG